MRPNRQASPTSFIMIRLPFVRLIALAAITVGCAGKNDDPDPANTNTDDTPTDTSSDDGPGPGDDEPGPSESDGEVEITPPAPGETTRLARLSHEQYTNTVQDLLGIDDDPSDAFAPDAQNGFTFQTSIDFLVDGRLGPQYRAAAESLATVVATDDVVFEHIVPCDAAQASCAREFISDFGARAFRRPLTDAEAEGFAGLFAQGNDLVGSGDDFKDGVSLVVQAMLQSPQFLYRTEYSNEIGPDGLIPLNDYEVASRLSYFIYNSMPDDELLSAAEAGELSGSDQVRAQVERMLQTDRALQTLVDFHDQAWHFSRFSKIAPDPSLFPDAPNDLVKRVQDAAHRYVQEVIDDGGGMSELLTAPFAYADSTIAPLYGQDVGGGMERIELDASERKGLLMQVGFLASNAYSLKTDPVHRGLFVVRDLLCREIPDPPPGAANSELPNDIPPPETTREEITILTSPPECLSCHTQINPPGFAFENFDAMGQRRSEENGVPVETSGSLLLDGQNVDFDGALSLVDAVAESDEALRCYATKWLEFARGRRLTQDELSVVDDLDSPAAVKELVITITTTHAFLTRTPNEEAR